MSIATKAFGSSQFFSVRVLLDFSNYEHLDLSNLQLLSTFWKSLKGQNKGHYILISVAELADRNNLFILLIVLAAGLMNRFSFRDKGSQIWQFAGCVHFPGIAATWIKLK